MVSQKQKETPSLLTRNPTHIGHYELLKTMGQGGFTKVRLGLHILIGSEVAIRVVNQQGSSCLQRLPLTEVYSQKPLNHPFLVKFFEMINPREILLLIMEHLMERPWRRIRPKAFSGSWYPLCSTATKGASSTESWSHRMCSLMLEGTSKWRTLDSAPQFIH